MKVDLSVFYISVITNGIKQNNSHYDKGELINGMYKFLSFNLITNHKFHTL